MEKNKHLVPVKHPFNWEVFQEPSGQLKSITQIVMEEAIAKSSREFFDKLSEYLKTNLKQFGHTFDTDHQFLDFCAARIRRISFSENPDYYEFYLDYIDDDNRGQFIGCYSDKVQIINEGNKITAIFG